MKFAGQTVGTGRRDIVEYWQRELLLYMGSHTVLQTVAHFDLPADTAELLRWVYNEVSHEQQEQVVEMVQGFAASSTK